VVARFRGTLRDGTVRDAGGRADRRRAPEGFDNRRDRRRRAADARIGVRLRGTVEERIDALIESKKQLVDEVLERGAEMLLTEMSDRDLLDLVHLDIHAARES
jgi:hypothetical protein